MSSIGRPQSISNPDVFLFQSLLCLLISTVPPNVSSSESIKVVPEGSSVDIVCQLDGNPSPDVTWTDQTTWQVVQTQTSQSTETRLTFNNANCLNTTTYRITATNSRGSDNTDIVLNVTCKICSRLDKRKIVHGVIVRIRKVEPAWWSVRSGQSFSYSHLWPHDWLFFLPISYDWSFDAIIQHFLHVYLEVNCIAMQRCYIMWQNRMSFMHQGEKK